ncbi:MAG: GSCFA domain-containing protein [Cyclobacteriaceae bacterium]|nr:GSCFA domain-containing protein [Cyclobacteriaceae bacterium]
MHFRTEIKIERAHHPINLKHDILTTGSCFSDAIGSRLSQNKFSVVVNPFGTTYNPLSIHKILRAALNNAFPASHSYFEHNGLYSHYDFHSAFSNPEKELIESAVKSTIRDTHTFLKTAHWIIITYGTSFVYKRNDTGDVVANCHKVPAQNFTKELLTEKKIVESFAGFYQNLKAVNPSCKIMLTVSPVRHIKDSIALNGASKAILRSACHTLSEQHAEVSYFPAFEIMMDDLRDYRFYKSDMLHPSPDAEDYIWEKFSEAYVDKPTLEFLSHWEQIHAALHHKPFHAQSDSHQAFLKKLLADLQNLRGTVNVDAEIASVKAQLNE